MKKNIFLAFLCFIFASLSFSQNINGRFSSSIYTFERFDSVETSAKYARAFQLLILNLNHSDFSLRSYLNLETDLSEDLKNDPRLRFYNLYFEARNVFDIATVKIGRQPIFSKVAGGTFDGANLDLKYKPYKFSFFYGANIPAYQKLELSDNWWKDDYIFGARFTTTALESFQISLGYVDKNFKPEEYFARRLTRSGDDANPVLDPITVLIRNKSNQFTYGSAEVDYKMESIFSVNTRYDYDFNYEKTSKFELFGSYLQLPKITLNLYYNYREPRIKYNSIFSVFDYGTTQEIELGGDYSFYKNYSFSGRFGYVSYKDENSQRITAGVNSDYGSLTYRKTFGYSGELDALSIYTAHSFEDGLLTPSLGLSFTGYKLSADSERNNLTTILLGINVRPLTKVSFDLQGQYMDNKIYKNDYRLFFKINYWFNENLNLIQ